MDSTTNKTKCAALCAVCLEEKQAFKTVGPCKHHFCVECLTKHVKNDEATAETFLCPSCIKVCELSKEGINSLPDYNFEAEDIKMDSSADVASAVDSQEAGQGDGAATACDTPTVLPCEICQYKDVVEVARTVCKRCDNLLLCSECTSDHVTLAVTAGHVLSILNAKKPGDANCAKHKKCTNQFCRTCMIPVCSMCVLLDHRQHDIVELETVIRETITNVNEKLETASVKKVKLQHLKSEMVAVREIILNWRGDMVQRIEETTDKAINQLLEQKQKLKEEINTACDISTLTSLLLKSPELEESIADGINKCQKVLSETSLDPYFLLDLKKTEKDIAKVLKSELFTFDGHWKLLQKPLPMFVENDACSAGLGCVTECCPYEKGLKLIKSQKYSKQETVIFGVLANVLGDKYVVAPVSPKSNIAKCDVFNANHERTNLFEQGFLDMAVTPNGELAVLHTIGVSHDWNNAVISVFNFNDEGKPCGEVVCKNIEKPKSFSINILGQFVVLSNADEKNQRIIVYGKHGDIIDSYDTRQSDIQRLRCGGRYFYILGELIEIYEMKNGEITFVDSVILTENVGDISATLTDDLFISTVGFEGINVIRVCKNGRFCEVKDQSILVRGAAIAGRTCLDVSHEWLALSIGSHWTVYKFNFKPASEA